MSESDRLAELKTKAHEVLNEHAIYEIINDYLNTHFQTELAKHSDRIESIEPDECTELLDSISQLKYKCIYCFNKQFRLIKLNDMTTFFGDEASAITR